MFSGFSRLLNTFFVSEKMAYKIFEVAYTLFQYYFVVVDVFIVLLFYLRLLKSSLLTAGPGSRSHAISDYDIN